MKFFVFVSLVFSFFSKANVDYEKEINKLLTSMTVEEKVGQIMMVEISHITPEEVKDYSIGAILNGGGSFPYGKLRIGKTWQTNISLHQRAVAWVFRLFGELMLYMDIII